MADSVGMSFFCIDDSPSMPDPYQRGGLRPHEVSMQVSVLSKCRAVYVVIAKETSTDQCLRDDSERGS